MSDEEAKNKAPEEKKEVVEPASEAPAEEKEVTGEKKEDIPQDSGEGTGEAVKDDTHEKEGKKEKEPERQDMTTLHERTIAALSYFGFLAIIPFYLKKDSEFCRFHGKQGMLLAIIFFMAKLFTVIDLLMDVVLILQIVVMFRMGFAALSGRWKKMAFFYDWACQLEEALTLKSKDEEIEEVALKPEEFKEESKTEEAKK